MQKNRNGASLGSLVAGAVALGAWMAMRRRAKAYRFRNKNVLITGGSRGLGLVMARELAAEGANLVVCARDHAELERAGAELTALGSRVLLLPCDLGSADEVRRMIRRARLEVGSIDVLINNAGIIQVGPEAEMTVEDYQEAMNVHFWAPFHAIRAVLPEMRARRAGRIVNISSIGGKIAAPHMLPYVASKFALTGFSEGLGTELAKDGVCVTTVIPGLMRTGSPRNAMFKGQHRAEHAWFHLSDSMPGLSLSARRAARQIIEACRHGRKEVVLGPVAKLAVRMQGLAPTTTLQTLALVNRVLPGPGGIGKKRAKGKDSESALAPSALTVLSNRAAKRNNEVAPERTTLTRRAG